eukprot:TRINITY_DN28566_c0_g1_i1.p1 TRINITY_DN28566_c0_g1~~TRINITY_DN28566_c0_g1_i1.p1  ORF type:complete len:163 (+),score=18.79 TRINITY_DN28566_c0_g1_i1:55-489(+)
MDDSETPVPTLRGIQKFMFDHYLEVWIGLGLLIVLYNIMPWLKKLIPKRVEQIDPERMVELDEEKRVARLLQQERLMALAQEQIQKDEQNQKDRMLEKVHGTRSTRLDDGVLPLSGLSNTQYYKPSGSMRKQGGCGGGGCGSRR